MRPERKSPDGLITTSRGDRRTLPVGLEAVQADWGRLWLMVAVNRWIREGISQEEIEQRLVRLIPRKPRRLTGTMTPVQMATIQNESRPEREGRKPLIFQGTFLDSKGRVVGADAEEEWGVDPSELDPELPEEVQDDAVLLSSPQMSFWEDL